LIYGLDRGRCAILLLHKYLYGIPSAMVAANGHRKRASFKVKKESIRVDYPWPGHNASARKFGCFLDS
jgi:hypothetical protein